MNKSRGSAADKWSDEETSILISVLHDDARKSGFKGYAISGPRLIEVRNEFFEKIGNRDKFDDEQIKSKIQRLRKDTKTFKDLLSSCSGYGWDPTTNTITCPSDIWSEHVAQKKKKKIYISKYRYYGLKDYDTLDEIFGNSFATGDHVMYSTNPNLPPKSNEVIVEEHKPSDGDDEPVATENTCLPMSQNTGSGSASVKRTLEPSEGGTSMPRKKGLATTLNHSHDYFREHLEWKRNKAEAKERRKHEEEQARAAKESEIDVYCEAAVTAHLQFILEKHDLVNKSFSPAVPYLLNPSFRKIFVEVLISRSTFEELRHIEGYS
ncbi:hypothetical protein KY285_030967 [Solanum tuberosum]|nr:hypothetical protein KY285_030967 [Solanum tuberosum]